MTRALRVMGLLLLCCAAAESAVDEHYEFTPMFGYQVAGGVDLAGPSFDHLSFADRPVAGLAIGFVNRDNVELEFSWLRSRSSAEIQNAGGAPSTSFDVRTDQYHLNALWMKGDDALQPFFLSGLGATHFSPQGARSSSLRLSGALGGGLKWSWTDYLGLRFDAQWDPVLTMNGSHWFCDDNSGSCYSTQNNSVWSRLFPLLNTMTFTTGLMFKY